MIYKFLWYYSQSNTYKMIHRHPLRWLLLFGGIIYIDIDVIWALTCMLFAVVDIPNTLKYTRL